MSDTPYFRDITRMPNLSEREILQRLELFVLPSEIPSGSAEATRVAVSPHAGGHPSFFSEGNIIYPTRFCAPFNTRNKGI